MRYTELQIRRNIQDALCNDCVSVNLPGNTQTVNTIFAHNSDFDKNENQAPILNLDLLTAGHP